jgi:tetratricopeptide (TPR) repeat protein
MTKAKRTATLVTALLACLMLTACAAQRYVTIVTAHVPKNRNIPDNIKSLVIMPILNKSGRPGVNDQIRALLMNKLQDSGRYQFSVRDDALKTLQAENMLSAAGLTTEGEETISSGVFEKVDAFIFGTVTNYSWNQRTDHRVRMVPKTRVRFNSDGTSSTWIETVREPYSVSIISANVACDFRMMDRAGKIIDTTACSKSFSGEFELGKVAVPTEGVKMEELAKTATEEFRRRIAPYREAVRFALLGGGGYEPGRQWAENNLLGDAIVFFTNKLAKDKLDEIAHYNLGLCYETNGQYEDAQKSYHEAFKLANANKTFMDARKRIAYKIKARDAGDIQPLVPNPT